METPTSLWYDRKRVICPLLVTRAHARLDQRIPGYIKGYVRRFWQVWRMGLVHGHALADPHRLGELRCLGSHFYHSICR